MSVLIKGMEMPSMCAECDFCGGLILSGNIYMCDCPGEVMHGVDITQAIDEDCRHPNCPLVDVPTPHGQLIDTDKLNIHDVSPAYGFCVMGVTEEDIRLADAVIEAESEE